jgi:hypothetical protein
MISPIVASENPFLLNRRAALLRILRRVCCLWSGEYGITLLPREAINIAHKNISHAKDYLEHPLSPTILRLIAKNIFGILHSEGGHQRAR